MPRDARILGTTINESVVSFSTLKGSWNPLGSCKDVGFSAFPLLWWCLWLLLLGRGTTHDSPTKMEPFFSRFGGCPFLRGPETRWLLQESALARENCDGCAFLIFFCHSSSSSSFPFNMLVTYSLVSSWYLRIVCMVIYIWLSWIRSSWESKAFIPTIWFLCYSSPQFLPGASSGVSGGWLTDTEATGFGGRRLACLTCVFFWNSTT